MLLQALIFEPGIVDRRVLHNILERERWSVTGVSALAELEAAGRQQAWDLVLCAVGRHITGDGLNWLSRLRRQLGIVPHITVLGEERASVAALEAVLLGASDYLAKPLQPAKVQRLLWAIRRQRETDVQESFAASGVINPAALAAEPTLIGNAASLVQVVRQLAQALDYSAGNDEASTARPLSFLLTGETGTGKELFAQLLHRRSSCSNGPFVAVNCSTLPAELAESELFGHESGAFTSAQRARPGLWMQANNGTLFLDEITEAPAALLPKLLRVLQDGQVRRVGSAHWSTTRVQVIAASNRDLAGDMTAGRMRRDLYHRFLHHLHLPPLRERREDIPLLVEHFAQRYATRPVQFSREALTLLQEHDWPGNVRELENLLRAALTQTGEGRVTAALLRSLWRAKGGGAFLAAVSVPPSDLLATAPLREQLNNFKRRTARETLVHCRGNITQAAQALGLTRPTFYRWLDDA